MGGTDTATKIGIGLVLFFLFAFFLQDRKENTEKASELERKWQDPCTWVHNDRPASCRR